MPLSAPSSSTRWRDEPVVPSDDADLASLIKAARKTRSAIVEFDWRLSRDDVEELRRAVYEWGRVFQGRYKVFDSRVLAALNKALGEAESIFVLPEPSNVGGANCDVTCVRETDGYRLCGHATFDVIFVYGSAGVVIGLPGTEHLGQAIRQTLAEAVVGLGWDPARLHEQRFQAVRNTLYGLPLDYGPTVSPSDGPAEDVRVHFHGPFKAVEEVGFRGLFGSELAGRAGVYLWTLPIDGEERPWYVGQTRVSFRTRMSQHLSAMLSGVYKTYDVNALAEGKYQLAKGAIKGRWPETLPSILANYERLLPDILGTIGLIRFHLATLPKDSRLLDRVEGMLGRYYKVHEEQRLRETLMPGLKLPAAIPGDSRLRLLLSSESPIAGLPEELTV